MTEPADDATFIGVQRFLTREAALLDDRDYPAWLELLAPDIRYQVSTQVSRPGEDGRLDYAIIDEDFMLLKMRVEQIADPKLTRAENPPTLTRRFVSNIEVETDGADTLLARSNLLVYRNRGTAPDGDLYAGRREDWLRRADDGFRIVGRTVRLDHTVLFDGSLSIIL